MAGNRGILRVLNVAEKPSVARAVSDILARTGGSGTARSRPGRSPYNRVFEFPYSISGRPCNMLMTSVSGHLMEMDFTEEHRKWNSCEPLSLFDAPVRKIIPQVRMCEQWLNFRAVVKL